MQEKATGRSGANSSTSGSSNQSNGTDPSGRKSIGLFERSGLAENLADDPLFMFFQKNWRFLVVLCVAFALAYFARSAYLQTFERTMRGAADVFAVTRREYQALVQAVEEVNKIEMDAEGGEEKLKQATENRDQVIVRLNSNLIALKNEREPYPALSVLYSGLARLAVGDVAEAQKELAALNWEKLPQEHTADRMFAELAALNVGRAKLDIEDEVMDGIALLKALARNGQFVNVSAATVLAMIADSEEERKAAADVIAGILVENPEQSDVLQSELDRLTE